MTGTLEQMSILPELELPAKPAQRQRRLPLVDPDWISEGFMSPEDVAKLTRSQRESRVTHLTEESNRILSLAIETFITGEDKNLAGVVGLFSGGNDSTTMCHIMLPRITHLAHANTTIGIEQTRQFVRDTATVWDKPLLEFKAPRERDHYRSLVLDQGFPGPGHHYKMYQRLKERALHEVRKSLVACRKDRVVYLAGRRRTESARRALVPIAERESSVVWVSPMVNWTKLDLNTYRLMRGDVPVNEVTDLIHMSGECLCGSFAHKGELDEIAQWFPDVAKEIHDLEHAISDRTDIPEKRKRWGWATREEVDSSSSGPMCSSCAARWEQDSLGDS